MQNIATKLWDTQGEITGIRIACDGRIVSYDLLINGRHSTRHRKFLQKIYLPRTDESGEEFLKTVVKLLIGEFCTESTGQARSGQD